MNIAIVHVNTINPLLGGVERVSEILTQELQNLGYHILFVSLNPANKLFPYQTVAPQVVLPSLDTNCSENISAFTKWVKDYKIDLILNQNGGIFGITKLCVAVKKNTHIKLISELHINPGCFVERIIFPGTFLNLKSKRSTSRLIKTFIYRLTRPYQRHKYLKLNSILYRYTYENSDSMVLLSELFIPRFIEIAKLSDYSKLTAIYNPLCLIKNRSLLLKKKQILFVGRLAIEQKRPDRIINIWKQIYKKYIDWSLIIVGDGDGLADLKDIAARYNLERIYFKGFCDPTPFYKDSDIICMTSSYEGFGMVLIEAEQYGVIPIGYESYESLRDIIEDGVNGFCIEPFNQDAFISALEKLMDDSDLRRKMSVEAINSVDKFDVKLIAKEWENLFIKIMKING